MKKVTKYKCPVCGNYTLNERGAYEICPVCFWEDEIDEIAEMFSSANGMTLEEAKENYKRVNACSEDMKNNVRDPLGIELPGFYESDNLEATTDQRFIKCKEYINDADKYYELAEENLLNYFEESHLEKYRKQTFEILNAIAFSEGEAGFKAAHDLSLCYAVGYGCKKDLDIAHFLNEEILRYYEIR